ncbi:outer membrane beta-barrel protein [Spirosoma sp. KNUC1025]|uniref:outer membrane beta-barrel protein n=1 Tax=Spirosoma sp. KNUC1025 TaxID=2894082 RepID=UPI0038685D4E|nr:PorT family protein [Spirosoma sp. KNUC1025]
MKLILYKTITLLLISGAFATAQSRFSVSAMLAPAYSHNHTRLNLLIPDGMGQTTNVQVSSNTSSVGYLAGAMFQYGFSDQWSISAGFWYNRVGTDGTFPFTLNPVPVRIINQDLQIPVLLNYRLTTKRLSPYFSVGSLANFRQKTIYRDESNTGEGNARVLFKDPVNYRAVVGVGVSYRVNQQWTLLFQPQLVWRFRPEGDFEAFTVYQLNGSFQLMYTF